MQRSRTECEWINSGCLFAILRSLKSRKDRNEVFANRYLHLKIQFAYQRLRNCRKRAEFELYNNIRSLYPTRVLSHSWGSSLYLTAGYKYVRSICLLTWKGRAASRALSRLAGFSLPPPSPSRNPFFHSAFRTSSSYEQPRGPFSLLPHDSFPRVWAIFLYCSQAFAS